MQISFCSETEAVLKLPPKLGSEAPIFFPPNFWPQFCFGSFRNDAELKPNVWPKKHSAIKDDKQKRRIQKLRERLRHLYCIHIFL